MDLILSLETTYLTSSPLFVHDEILESSFSKKPPPRMFKRELLVQVLMLAAMPATDTTSKVATVPKDAKERMVVRGLSAKDSVSTSRMKMRMWIKVVCSILSGGISSHKIFFFSLAT